MAVFVAIFLGSTLSADATDIDATSFSTLGGSLHDIANAAEPKSTASKLGNAQGNCADVSECTPRPA